MPSEGGGKDLGEKDNELVWDIMKLECFCDIQIKRSCRQ